MSIINSNSPHFQPAEHVFFRLYEPCDFCRVSMEEEMLSKVDGYNLCQDCKEEYLEDQKNNAELTN